LQSRFLSEASEALQVIGVVESIAFLIAANVARMRGSRVCRILASGGLSASDYLCECVATLTGLRVERTDLRESTATGLGFLVAGQPADWQTQAQVTPFTPQPDAALAERYATFCRAMDAEADKKK
jgi:sugar (pentulose or hexulose) kinase